MKKLILVLMFFMSLTSHAEVKNSEVEKIFGTSYFENPIDKSQIHKLDQQIILSNFAISATGYFNHRCPKVSPIYDKKIKLVKNNLLTIFPTIQSDWNQTLFLQDNFEKLNKDQMATLEVITAVNRLNETFTDEPLIDKSLCDKFIDNYSGKDAKKNWLDYYQRALPVLIEQFNEVYKK